MTDPGLPQSSWQGVTGRDNSRLHLGHNIGGVQHITYDNQKSPYERLLDSLAFPGMYRYQERPLESYKETYEWLFDDNKATCSCGNCPQFAGDVDVWPLTAVEREQVWQHKRATKDRELVLQEADKFRSWLRTSQEIFWVSGKAGAGKSCLMKFLLEHQSTADLLCDCAGQEVTIVGFFFWAAGGTLEKSHIGLLRSLLHQILQKHPHLGRLLLHGKSGSEVERPWTIARLSDALRVVLEDPITSSSFAFFIDGLDEFNGDTTDLLRALNALNRSPNIKLCVSSRPWNVFQNMYGSRTSTLQLRLHDVNCQDINAYIQGRLVEDLGMQDGPGAEKYEQHQILSTAIMKKAEGVFLWVYLVVKGLRQAFVNSWTIDEMLESLGEAPSELDALIQSLYQRIPSLHRLQAARTFLLLLECEKHMYAQFHLLWLSISERGGYDASRGSDYPFPQSVLDEMTNEAERSARKWCGDLVNVVRDSCREKTKGDAKEQLFPHRFLNYVQFPHRSIRDFIAKQKEDGDLVKLAGEDFCPAFAICSTIIEVGRCVGPSHSAFARLSYSFVLASNHVGTGKQTPLVELAKRYDSLAQGTQEEPAESYDSSAWGSRRVHVHWSLEDVHLTSIVGRDSRYHRSPVDLGGVSALFLAYILLLGGSKLFWLMFSSTSEYHDAESRQLWLGSILAYTSSVSFEVDDHYHDVSKLLQQGADVNKPTGNEAGECSIWQRYLLTMHPFLGPDETLVRHLDVLLAHGADPDVDLELDWLYRFLKEPERSKEMSTIVPNPIWGDYTSPMPAWSSSLNKQYDNDEDVPLPLTRSRIVPATAAFEIPSRNARYDFEDNRERVERTFPIIKARLVAASEEKARKQRSQEVEVAGTSKRKRSSSGGAETEAQRRVGREGMPDISRDVRSRRSVLTLL